LKLAAAPISWGVCEVPGWGHQLDPARVLADARRLGFTAIEAGPPGFLPPDASAAAALCAEHGLGIVGGFVTAVLHSAHPDIDALSQSASWLSEAGAGVLVLAAATGVPGYEAAFEMTAKEWRRLLDSMREAAAIAADEGIALAVHPHVGTAIERPEDITRLLDGSDVDLCLDTGHVFVGGGDPVAIAKAAGDRVRHVHLKDVDGALALTVRERRMGYAEAVRRGLYRPLGKGDARIGDVIAQLDARGYDGWGVLEQDVALDDEAADPSVWVEESLAFLKTRV
jgi:inosose dehydratase